MDYSEAERYLQGLTDYEKSTSILYNPANYDLRRMHLLLSALGDPHKGRTTVHIAGTKGKGSTAAMISSILTAAGYRTGRFTSPHLFSWQERIAFNGRPITKRDFARIAGTVRNHVGVINTEARFGKLTTFEALTAMAFSYFREKKVDVQVLETGMGGKLDSTNVVDRPDVCIVTSISLDHTQVLGNTVAQIANEKAGIIKPGCTLISAPQPAGAMKVIEKTQRQTLTPLVLAGRDVTWENQGSNWRRQVFSVHSKSCSYTLKLPLLGDYQMENAALAIAAIEALQEKGVNTDCTHIMRGMSQVKWPVRLQVLSRNPWLIADGAHNPYSIKKVIESINKYFPHKKTSVIFGSSQDKDIEGMAKELAGFADRVILTASSHPRAATTDRLLAAFQNSGVQCRAIGSADEALSSILNDIGKDDLILATGSLFLAAAVHEAFTRRREFL
jgi:dihydrofolate synthase / folylpolyglutamate synthase